MSHIFLDFAPEGSDDDASHKASGVVGVMMGGGVFVLTDQNTLVSMEPTLFVKEADFQKLLADFPALLVSEPGAATDRPLLFICREKSVPDSDGGSARWSLDHLFIDQEGIPTLVEVKRQSDSRLRREVVGQMLDYAANAVAYWPVEELRQKFQDRCDAEGQDVDEVIRTVLGPEADAEAFWQRVKTNLQAGRIRMLFVADDIPSELRRVVEFLNQQMDPAEVLALELRQYSGQGLKTIVPTLFGQTEEARVKKSVARTGRQWDEQSIYEEINRRFGPDQAIAAQRIGAWINSNADRVWYGQGAKSGSMCAVFRSAGQDLYPLNLWTSGKVEIGFQTIQKPPFDDRAKREELARRLNQIGGVAIQDDALDLRPSIPLQRLTPEAALVILLQAMDWFVAQLKGQ
jgi:hypothetical protein